MVTRKEDTASRVARRKYEEKNKKLRKEKNANFQTMIPRELFEEINVFLTEKGMTKVDFIKKAFEIKLAFKAAKEFPKECKQTRVDIDRRVVEVIKEWKK